MSSVGQPFEMLIGVISDSHGQVEFTKAGLREFEKAGTERVLHCGDIGTADIVSLFTDWPTHFVFGNIDRDREGLRAAIDAAGQTCHDEFGSVRWDGRDIAFLHGDDDWLLHDTIASGRWDLVCHGHTHVPKHESCGRTLVLNPGAVYRAKPHTVAVVELPSMETRFLELP